jgi:hypothetical protein
MGTVVAYANDQRHCFCQIKFESGERVLISVSGPPNAAVKIYKLLFGALPIGTVWECSAAKTGGFDNYVHKLHVMFPEVAHPLDSIRDRLLKCTSIDEAVKALLATERHTPS